MAAPTNEAARHARAAALIGETAVNHPDRAARGADRGIEAKLARLTALSNHDLRIEWRRLYRSDPPTRLSRDLLLRAVAYKIQERTCGGLSAATKRRLRGFAQALAANGDAALAPDLSLKPGARLVRGWHGQTHVVTVLDDGFDYAGRRHRSLTEIAKLITGTHWSGPRFFGLAGRKGPTPSCRA